MESIFESIQSGVEMLSYLEVYDDMQSVVCVIV